MPEPPQSSADQYREQQRLALLTDLGAQRLWQRMSGDLDQAWAGIAPALTALVTAGQLAAAQSGIAYIPRVLNETGQPDSPVAELLPLALAGTAADGRNLTDLLFGSVVQTRTALGGEIGLSDSLAQGSRWLSMAVTGQIADAGRSGASVAMAVRPSVTGYVRVLQLPSCSRCVVLAGKRFKWNTGFLRHIACDCRHLPSSDALAGDLRADPMAAYRSGQIRGLSRAERRALDAGADIGQAVNARRGRSSGLSTTEGTTRRGLAGQRAPGRRRLTPDGIYRVASDRAEALTLLRRHGYII